MGTDNRYPAVRHQTPRSPLLMLLSLLCLVLVVPSARAQEASAYTLAIGDVISINVFDEPDLSFERVLITDAGTIPFPFLGEVPATGLTVTQIQQSIVSGLKPDYLVDPKVTISIVEYRPFFLTGEVERPGSIPYQPGLTLRQAITLAGGLTERASTSRITVIPGGGNATSRRINLDYEVKPGDTITIEQSFF
jgi:protein involved in polysaccharide export with SLBB domain